MHGDERRAGGSRRVNDRRSRELLRSTTTVLAVDGAGLLEVPLWSDEGQQDDADGPAETTSAAAVAASSAKAANREEPIRAPPAGEPGLRPPADDAASAAQAAGGAVGRPQQHGRSWWQLLLRRRRRARGAESTATAEAPALADKRMKRQTMDQLEQEESGVAGFVEWVAAASGMARAALPQLLEKGAGAAASIANAAVRRPLVTLSSAAASLSPARKQHQQQSRAKGTRLPAADSGAGAPPDDIEAAAAHAPTPAIDDTTAAAASAGGSGSWEDPCFGAADRELLTRAALLEGLARFDESLLRAREAAYYSDSDSAKIEETFLGCSPLTARMAFAFCLRAFALAPCPGEGVPFRLCRDRGSTSTPPQPAEKPHPLRKRRGFFLSSLCIWWWSLPARITQAVLCAENLARALYACKIAAAVVVAAVIAIPITGDKRMADSGMDATARFLLLRHASNTGSNTTAGSGVWATTAVALVGMRHNFYFGGSLRMAGDRILGTVIGSFMCAAPVRCGSEGGLFTPISFPRLRTNV